MLIPRELQKPERKQKMSVRLIIAHPSPEYCKGLSKRFSCKATILSIDEITTSEELERKLSIERADVVIAEQSLLKDLSLAVEGDVILIMREPYLTRLFEALIGVLPGSEESHGGKGELTLREQEVQELKDQHFTNQEIAKKLSLSEKTAKKAC